MDTARATFRGLSVYRDLRHRFSLLYPEGWTCRKLPAERGHGSVCYPDPTDAATYLLIQSQRFPRPVMPEDLETLRQGLLDGLRALPQAAIEQVEAKAIGPLLDLQARHTFREEEATRKRWTRQLYQGKVQISLAAQGACDAAFAYWLPMFNSAMRTVQFADWWAEATGVSWQRRLTPARGG